MSNALKSKTVDSKTVGDSLKESEQTVEQAISAIDAILNAKTTVSKNTKVPTDWVGTVTLVNETVNLAASFITTCKRRKGQIAMIKALAEKIKENGGSYTFDSVGDVEHFDSTVVTEVYKNIFGKELEAAGNPRMGHEWGLSLIGKCSFLDPKPTIEINKWLKAIGRPDGNVAFFKVTKKSS